MEVFASNKKGYFIRVSSGEAVRLIKSLSAQIISGDPNVEREEFTTNKGKYFSISVHRNLD